MRHPRRCLRRPVEPARRTAKGRRRAPPRWPASRPSPRGASCPSLDLLTSAKAVGAPSHEMRTGTLHVTVDRATSVPRRSPAIQSVCGSESPSRWKEGTPRTQNPRGALDAEENPAISRVGDGYESGQRTGSRSVRRRTLARMDGQAGFCIGTPPTGAVSAAAPDLPGALVPSRRSFLRRGRSGRSRAATERLRDPLRCAHCRGPCRDRAGSSRSR